MNPKTHRQNDESEMSPITNNQNEAGNNEEDAMPENNRPNKVIILIDSHGNNLNEKKMYKNNYAKVMVLGAGKKNISGTHEAMTSSTDIDNQTEIIIAVESNDLDGKNPDQVLYEMSQLLNKGTELYPRSCIGILPAFRE